MFHITATMIKFFKCRNDIFQGIQHNISDPGEDFYGIVDIHHKPKSRYSEYNEYHGTTFKDEYNILPSKALAYINIDNNTYGVLIRHNLTIVQKSNANEEQSDLMDKMKSLGIKANIIDVAAYSTGIDQAKYDEMPSEQWLQIGNKGDQVILQIKVAKVPFLTTNRDDFTGELYFYSPIKVVALIKK